jgi:uncharacterized delta-60 repeat protein
MWFLNSRKTRRTADRRPGRSSYRPRLEWLETRCLLSGPGSLDTTFGSGGIVMTSLSNPGDQAFASVLQPNGDIVAVGGTISGSHHKSTPAFALVRYTPSGNLDTTFGSGGEVVTVFGGTDAHAYAAALYPNAGTGNDGKIVAVGGNGNVQLARYNPNGSLDTTFGNGGEVSTALSNSAYGYSVALQSDGKIVVGGALLVNAGLNVWDFVVLRYNVNGTLDSTFGAGGEVTTSLGPTTHDGINSLEIQSDGKIVAGGEAEVNNQFDFGLARYNANGSLDSTFGSGGIVSTAWSSQSEIFGLALQSDGKIVAVGSVSVPSGNEWAMARYNTGGTLDTTFGSGGLVATNMPSPGTCKATAVAIQSNGEIVAAGNAPGNGTVPPSFGVATYTAAGALDPGFGGTGVVTTAIGTGAKAASVLVQPADGKVVVVGWAGDASKSGAPDFAVARYIGTTTTARIGSLTASPNPATSGSSSTSLTASNITDADPGSSNTQATFYHLDSTGNELTLGNCTQTNPGVWTPTYMANLASVTHTQYTQAEDSYGVFGDLVALTLTVQ